MIFNSYAFLAFFPIVTLAYYLMPMRARRPWLLAASYYFYMCWNAQYALLIAASTLVTYLCALALGRMEAKAGRRAVLALGLAINLGILCFFKYFGFFTDTFARIAARLGVRMSIPAFDVLLPVGISFYTFQALGYMIDVYRGKLPPERSLMRYALFVSFFPQLVAGPIVRYTTVAEEFDERHESISEFSAGAVRFLFGLGKKMLLANAVARIADAALAALMPSVLFAWLGAVAYTFQIYFDFSAYSDMAIGLGRMFGFHFLENFNYPYVARSVTEFWRRWHISLSTWFRDYVYIPLGGNRCSRARNVWNLFVVWFLTGMWHGASWNFIAWGLWFFVLLVGEKLLWGKALERLPSLVRHAYAMVLVVFSWVLFRAETLTAAAAYFAAMFGSSGVWCGSRVVYYALEFWPELLCCCIAALPVKQWLETALQKRDAAPARAVLTWGPKLAAMALLACSYCKLVTGSFNPFIYFRF